MLSASASAPTVMRGWGSLTPPPLCQPTLPCSYAERVRTSAQHSDYYERAIRNIEFEMTRIRFVYRAAMIVLHRGGGGVGGVGGGWDGVGGGWVGGDVGSGRSVRNTAIKIRGVLWLADC